MALSRTFDTYTRVSDVGGRESDSPEVQEAAALPGRLASGRLAIRVTVRHDRAVVVALDGHRDADDVRAVISDR